MADKHPLTCPACGAAWAPAENAAQITCPECGWITPISPVVAAKALVLRRENKLLLAIGMVLLMLAWIGTAVSLAVFLEQVGTLAVCLVVLVGPAVVGLILIMMGLNQKHTINDPKTALGKHVQAQQDWLAAEGEGGMDWIDEGERVAQYWQAQQLQAKLSSHKMRRRLRIWALVLIAVGVETLILAYLILRETSIEVRMMFIPLAVLPAMVGLLLWCRAWGIRRRDENNLEALQAYMEGL